MDTSKQMPNLVGAAHGAADGNRRILAQLEHGARATSRASRPARAWSLDGWAVGLVLLLLTMAAVAWLMHEEAITPVTFKSHVAGSRAAENRPAAMATAVPVTTAAEQSRPAAIVNETRLQAAGPVAATGPNSAAMAHAPAARQADQAHTGNHGAGRDKPAQTTATQHPGRGAVPAGTGRASTGAAVTTDTDVTLLTALVAHAGKPASVTLERSRDVVERADGVPTAELLARCKQLGLMEGLLCRSRICSGNWEPDPACRVPAQ